MRPTSLGLVLGALALPTLRAQDPLRLHETLDASDARWHGAKVTDGAAHFDGSGAHIEVGTCGVTAATAFTLRCRLRTTAAGFCTPLMARDGDDVAVSLTLGRQPGVLSFEAWSWRTVQLATRTRVDDGQWHQVEVAYDPTSNVALLRLDGHVQAAAELGQGGATNARLRLGDNIGARQPFAGELDELVVMDTTAGLADVRQHAPLLSLAERQSALQDLRARLLPKCTPSLAADAAAAWPARRQAVRQHVADCLGLSPVPDAGALDVQVHGERERDGVRVQRISWVGFPGQRATGWLWSLRDAPPGRRPAVLCPHGHWQHGARDPVVQARCASFARFGWLVLAVDSVHVEDVASGVSAIGVMTWHNLRALELLGQRDDVDAARIAVTGASGGGQQTYYLMALADQPAAAAPMVMACYFAEIVDDTSAHCSCNHPPRLAAATDVPELCAVFAPRPAMFGSVSGDWTRNFPREGLPELAAHWQRLGAPAPRARHADERHNYDRPMREEVYAFLHDALLGPAADGQPRQRVAEPAFAPFAPGELQRVAAAGPDGTPKAAALVHEQLARRPQVATLAALAPGLDLAIARRSIAWRDAEGARWRGGTVTGSDGVPIPLRVTAAAADAHWQLRVDPRGMATAMAEPVDGADAVAVVDARPYGSWATFRSAWQRNGLLLGRGEGYQAAVDVALAAASLPGDGPVHVVGRGEAGVVAVLAAHLCPRITRVTADQLGEAYAEEGNRWPLCPELLRWRDLPELVDALPAGCWQGPAQPARAR